jgi:hypothetical protein
MMNNDEKTLYANNAEHMVRKSLILKHVDWEPCDVSELNLGSRASSPATAARLQHEPKHTMAFTALNNQAPSQPPPAQAPVPKPVQASVVPIQHPQEIDAAFASNADLRKRVHAAINQNPSQSTLFRDISTFILNQTPQVSAEPTMKKRKIEESNGAQNGAAAATSATTPTAGAGGSLTSTSTKAFKTYAGVSFSIPQRKKFTLELVDKRDGGIRSIGASGNVEFVLSWKDVDQIFCLPVPEKAKKQHNFIIIPLHGDGVNPVPEELKASTPEPIVWTFEEATGKNIVEGEDPGPGPMAEAIHHCLIQAGTGKEVIFPDADEFASAVPESHRKGEKAYHVKAHRGSKEGTSMQCMNPETVTYTSAQATCSSPPSVSSTASRSLSRSSISPLSTV